MLATTVQLWLGRWTSRRTHVVIVVLLAVLAVASGVTVARLATASPDRAGQARPAPAAAVSGGEAAGWIVGQVSRTVTLACDPGTCSLLARHGFPAGNLVMLRRGALDPLDSSLMVVTPVLKSEFGRRLAADAPAVLASFGAGRARVEIRAIAPGGPASYLSQFRDDLAARKSVGTELLLNPAVDADPSARPQLSSGDVDSRLIAVIVIMAALHPVHLVSFGDPSPGASPGIPLRSAVLYPVSPGPAALDSLRALLRAQHPAYRPAGIQNVALAGGRGALRIEFAAPDPLGLLDASPPLVKISSP